MSEEQLTTETVTETTNNVETPVEQLDEPVAIDFSSPATAYCYNKETGEYTGTEPCQYDPLESIVAKTAVWLLPADATFVQPTLTPQEGQALCWNGAAWELKEDHRQKHDNGGAPIDGTGTPYWLPGDSYGSTARYMDTLGPLPESAVLTAPVKSEEQLWAELRMERNYRLKACDYLFMSDYPVEQEELTSIKQYRQALRDLPAQEGAPWDGGGENTPWPQEPVTPYKF